MAAGQSVKLPSAEEYRVSWTMWIPGQDGPVHREYIKPKYAAERQYQGLLAMIAPHGLRPCGEHIWNPTLAVRSVQPSEWKVLEAR